MVVKKKVQKPKTDKVIVHLDGWWYVLPASAKGRRAQIEATKTVIGYPSEREAHAAL